MTEDSFPSRAEFWDVEKGGLSGLMLPAAAGSSISPPRSLRRGGRETGGTLDLVMRGMRPGPPVAASGLPVFTVMCGNDSRNFTERDHSKVVARRAPVL